MRVFGTNGVATNTAITAADQAIPLPATIPQGGCQMRLCVTGTVAIFVQFNNTVSTLAGSMAMAPNTSEIFDCPPGTVIRAISTGVGSQLSVALGNAAMA